MYETLQIMRYLSYQLVIAIFLNHQQYDPFGSCSHDIFFNSPLKNGWVKRYFRIFWDAKIPYFQWRICC